MSVAVTRRRTAGRPARVQLDFLSAVSRPMQAPGLPYDCLLGASVKVRIDAANPSQWQVIWIDRWDDESRPLLRALIGTPAMQQLEHRLLDAEPAELELDWIDLQWADLAAAEPWLRVAATDALDRWLQLPLNQCLVDAERGVARGQAARTLAPGRARDEVLTEALRLARAASWGFVGYLGRLSRRPHPVPENLRKVLNDLIEGYQSLAAELAEPDQDLQSVVAAGRGLLDRLTTGITTGIATGGAWNLDAAGSPPGTGKSAPPGRWTSLIDPRQIPARVLRLSDQPTVGEVTMRWTQIGGLDAVEVEVPAYHPRLDDLRGSGASERLIVRLVEQATGLVREEALLTLEQPTPTGDAASYVFRGVMPLLDADLNGLRADVLDVSIELPPATSDSDPELLAARRATGLLSRWRGLVAVGRLGLRADHLLAQARIVTGDPAVTLDELTDVGAAPGRSGAATGTARSAITAGPGELLVAEVDAASQRHAG